MELPPFLSEEPLEGDPPCLWADFLAPKLRRYPHLPKRINWGPDFWHGVEGCVAGVRFDDDHELFAIKVVRELSPSLSFIAALPHVPDTIGWQFFKSKPAKLDKFWPFEREARTVAVLEKVRAGLRQSSPLPIYVPSNMTTRCDALGALFACSTDGLQRRVFDGLPPRQRVAISASSTRIRNCFGWIRLRGSDLLGLNCKIKRNERDASKGFLAASYFEPGNHYFAIVYEFVPREKTETDAVQAQLEFFHRTGFSRCQPLKPDNWQGPGILLDFGDINSAVDPWFDESSYRRPLPPTEMIVDYQGYHKRMAERVRQIDKEQPRAEDYRGATEAGHSGATPVDSKAGCGYIKKKSESGGLRGEDVRSRGDGNKSPDNHGAGEYDGVREPSIFVHVPEAGHERLSHAWRSYAELKSKFISSIVDANKEPIFHSGRSGPGGPYRC
ncbi:hypothetical protein DL768_001613 [Monosporascus sp. mg162]|nr:hypothetical protein DL768_001613 [Monosporascus sp. mg162]